MRGMKCLSMNEVRVIESCRSQRVRVRVKFRAVLCSNIAQFLTILRILHCRMGLQNGFGGSA